MQVSTKLRADYRRALGDLGAVRALRAVTASEVDSRYRSPEPCTQPSAVKRLRCSESSMPVAMGIKSNALATAMPARQTLSATESLRAAMAHARSSWMARMGA